MNLWNRKRSERFNAAVFLSGRTVSSLISTVYGFAVGLYVLKKTGSGLSFALTLTLQILPTVALGPFAGVLADRMSKKLLTVLADAAAGAVSLAFFLVGQRGVTVSEVVLSMFLVSVCQAVYNVCIDTAIPDIVSPRNIPRMNAVGKTVDSAAALLGPALGGVLYALVGLRMIILLNAVSFLFSAASECLIDFTLFAACPMRTEAPNLKTELAQGIRLIRGTPWMLRLVLNFALMNFLFSLLYTVPVPVILNGTYRLSPVLYSTVQCFLPAGMVLGAFAASAASKALGHGGLMKAAGLLFSVCMVLAGALPGLFEHLPPAAVVGYYAILLLILGAVVSLIDLPFINRFQIDVPENFRGRALSLSMSAVKAVSPAGFVLSGALCGAVPVFLIPLVGGAALLPVYGLLKRG